MHVFSRMEFKCDCSILLALVCSAAVLTKGISFPQPNILLIVADDLGWDDVGFHGSTQVRTPNIDALAMDGIILNNYYVEPLCTPSRASLLTGRHPSQIGMQDGVILPGEPWGLPLELKTLPQYMKDLNYSTHLIGKWHLGSFRREYWPTKRGFDTFFGYVSDGIDYYLHTQRHLGGFDLWENETLVADKYMGQYSTQLFQKRALDIIESHRHETGSLFLMLSFQSVHTGSILDQFQCPTAFTQRLGHIKDPKRQKFAGMLLAMDDAIGAVFLALERRSFLNNTLIIFTTDNGGLSYGTKDAFETGAGSNWPLRGSKGTSYEGGIRGVSFIWSNYLKIRGSISNHLTHISDWLPTIYAAAGGDSTSLAKVDGINHWNAYASTNNAGTLRNELLLVHGNGAKAYRYKNYKLISVNSSLANSFNGWYIPPERDVGSRNNGTCTVDKVMSRSLHRQNQFTNRLSAINVNCHHSLKSHITCDLQKAPCLFDLISDPCEYRNIARERPKLTQKLLEKLENYGTTVAAARRKKPDSLCLLAFDRGPCK